MKARAVAALALVFLQPWMAANERSISHIRNPQVRHAQAAVFARTVRALHDSERTPAVQPAVQPDAVAAQILSDHRRFTFAAVQKPPPKTWLERLQDWFAQRWSAILKGLFGNVRLSARTSTTIGDVLLALALAAFFALLARLFWQYARRSAPARTDAYGLDRHESAASLAGRAQHHAQRAEYNAATALLFAAALQVLSDRGALTLDRSRTLGELRRIIARNAPGVADAFSALGAQLARSVYADATLDAADWESALAAYGQIRRLERADAA